jgi:hypothetical protein
MADRSQSDIQSYDSDHTALVHVLWEARRRGWTLDDYDEVAALIMRSRWMEAVRLHAAEPPVSALEGKEKTR